MLKMEKLLHEPNLNISISSQQSTFKLLFFLQLHPVSFPHDLGAGSNLNHWRTCFVFQTDGSEVGTCNCLVLGNRLGRQMSVFWWLVSLRHCITELFSGNVWMESTALKSSSVAAHGRSSSSVFTSVLCVCLGWWNDFLPRNVKSFVNKSLSYKVNLFSFIVGWRLQVYQCWSVVYLLTCTLLLW
jgi:hypothetical protein